MSKYIFRCWLTCDSTSFSHSRWSLRFELLYNSLKALPNWVRGRSFWKCLLFSDRSSQGFEAILSVVTFFIPQTLISAAPPLAWPPWPWWPWWSWWAWLGDPQILIIRGMHPLGINGSGISGSSLGEDSPWVILICTSITRTGPSE